jgi:hypothetical protein
VPHTPSNTSNVPLTAPRLRGIRIIPVTTITF